MTRANVLLIGLAVFLLGGVGFGLFRVVGLETASAGIAAEAFLVLIVVGWTMSYLFRVVTGNMTFNEQRKRYREAYDQATTEELESKLELLSEEQQSILLDGLDKDN